MDLKLGRLAATRPFGLSNLTAYANGKLPKPPRSVEAPDVGEWGMLGNDRCGDCTMAGVAHALMAWNATLNEHDTVPSETTVVETYYSLTGGADSGLNEANVLNRWQRVGLFGNKIDAYAPVNPRDIAELQQAIAFYGGSYLGIMCPRSAQEDFAAGRPWTYDPSSPVDGGHCIHAIGYTPSAVLCVSWGQVCEVAYPFLAHMLEEAWAIIPNEMVERGEDALGLNLAQLRADLSQV